MKVLGIDPSTTTGLAIADEDCKVLYAKEISFPKLRGFERTSSIMAEILGLVEREKPDLIVIEAMIVGRASSAISMISIGSILRYFLWQEDLGNLDVSPSTLKKFVTGKGQAKKEEIMMYVLKNWGYASQTNNVADAVGLAMLGVCRLGGGKFTAAQNKVVDQIQI